MKHDEGTVVMTRILDAPRSRVFEAWTRAEHLGRWYAPKGFTITDCAADPRPGGVFRMRWRAPWGGDYTVNGQYREVLALERVVITCTLIDEEDASHLEEFIDVRFEEAGSRTRLRLESTAQGHGEKAAHMLAGIEKGWTQTVDRLGVLLDPKPEKEM